MKVKYIYIEHLAKSEQKEEEVVRFRGWESKSHGNKGCVRLATTKPNFFKFQASLLQIKSSKARETSLERETSKNK